MFVYYASVIATRQDSRCVLCTLSHLGYSRWTGCFYRRWLPQFNKQVIVCCKVTRAVHMCDALGSVTVEYRENGYARMILTNNPLVESTVNTLPQRRNGNIVNTKLNNANWNVIFTNFCFCFCVSKSTEKAICLFCFCNQGVFAVKWYFVGDTLALDFSMMTVKFVRILSGFLAFWTAKEFLLHA